MELVVDDFIVTKTVVKAARALRAHETSLDIIANIR